MSVERCDAVALPVVGTLDRTSMLLFAFDVMDVDSGGEIDGEEMTRCLVEVCVFADVTACY